MVDGVVILENFVLDNDFFGVMQTRWRLLDEKFNILDGNARWICFIQFK
jgi:hypothetical protein